MIFAMLWQLFYIHNESGVIGIGNVVDESVITDTFAIEYIFNCIGISFVSISTLIIFLSHKIKWTYFVEQLEICLYRNFPFVNNICRMKINVS